ncbi:MAG: M28 family metallopeptidase [Phycisphaerales bacterium]
MPNDPRALLRHVALSALLITLAGCASSGPSQPAASSPPPPAAVANAPATTKAPVVKPGSYSVIEGKQAPIPPVQMGDRATIQRIIDEGSRRNKVMDHLTHLATQIGPRLTGSSNVDAANRWTADQFKAWGLTNVELHQWGTIPVRFDRGPSTGKIVAKRGDEWRSVRDLEFTTLAWAAGTNGATRGQVVKMPETEEEFAAVESKLKGAWVLIKATAPGGRRGVGGFAGGMTARQTFFSDMRKKMAGEKVAEPAPAEPKPAPAAAIPADGISGRYEGTATGGPIPGDGTPFTLDVRLGEKSGDKQVATGSFGYPGWHTGPFKNGTFNPETKEVTFTWESPAQTADYTLKLDGGKVTGTRPVPDQKPLVLTGERKDQPAEAEAEEPKGPSIEERVFMAGPAGYLSASNDDRVRTSSIRGWRELTMEKIPKDVEIQVRQADYDHMNSRLADGSEIFAEFDLPHTFTAGPIPVYNTIAEIRGTEKPDEVVIVSAHLDSWNGPGSQGTTDNGTGSSVTLEAARILMAAKAKPKRTIRFILWTGEEQGLLGSREYVKMLKEKDLLKNISACFVDDGGTNYEGGLQGIDSQVEFLAAATAPVNGVFYSPTDGKWLDVNIRAGRRMGGGMAGGSSDHASFLAAGVPGFFWDEVGRADYGYGWHTQNDKLNLAIPEYLMQSSTCAAVTAYNLACAPSLLPREPLKKPEAETKPEEKPAPPAQPRPDTP